MESLVSLLLLECFYIVCRFFHPRIRSLKIAHTWKGKALSPNETVDLHLQVDSSYSNLVLNVNAPFYKDPAPTQPIGPYAELYTQGEVVHLYLLSYPDFKYLEVQVGPYV